MTKAFEVVFLDPRRARFERRGDTLSLTLLADEGDANATYYPRVALRACFPMSDNTAFLSVRDATDETLPKLGIIEDWKRLQPESRDAVTAELRLHYFVPEIAQIFNIKEESGFLYRMVQTEKGRKEFLMRNSVIHYAREVAPGHRLLIDVNEARYEVGERIEHVAHPETRAIDSQSISVIMRSALKILSKKTRRRALINSWPVTAINLTYLCILWVLFIATIVRIPRLSVERRRSAGWVLAALFLLAFGDSFHLLSQAYETATGINPPSPFWGLTWIGFGRLTSSITLTIFYLCLLFYCRRKFGLRWTGWLWLLLVSFVVRMVLLTFPQNNWDGGRTLWSIWRNIPFVIQGVGVMGILFQQAPCHSLPLRRQLQALAYAMLVSFATYTGTIVGVFWHPAFGALMLPKTIAYVVVAWLLYAIEFKDGTGF